MSTITSSGPSVNPIQTRKRPRAKPKRFVRVLFNLPTSGEIAVRIEERGPRSEKFTHYYVRVLPCDFGFATSWQKWTTDGGDGTVYQTNVGGESIVGEDEDGETVTAGEAPHCDCLGHEKHGHCRHVEATLALLKANKL